MYTGFMKKERRIMKLELGSKGRFLKLALSSGITLLLVVSLFFALQKPVTIEVDGKCIQTSCFFNTTVQDILDEQNIVVGDYDKVQPAVQSIVQKHQVIKITRANRVTIIAGEEKKEIYTVPVSIKKAIELAGFTLGPKDIVKTLAVEKTVPDQVIEIIRVTEKEEQIQEKIPFPTETTTDNTLEKGLTRTIQAGESGIALSTVKYTYHNGQQVSKEVIKSETVKEPKPAIIAMGNITSVSRGGQNINFSRAYTMQASAYTYTGRNTACGIPPAVGIVAVDPNVIKLGSRLYIEGYGYATAADTGGSIKGNRIDVFMENKSQCMSWGRRTVKVYLLN
jgi:uncharacterized protein YabE (DUF348 family)